MIQPHLIYDHPSLSLGSTDHVSVIIIYFLLIIIMIIFSFFNFIYVNKWFNYEFKEEFDCVQGQGGF